MTIGERANTGAPGAVGRPAEAVKLPSCLRVGTRGSRLARVQTAWVMERLSRAYPALAMEEQILSTQPDRRPDLPIADMGDKALFVSEIEAALRRGEIDLAVHSLKDMPSELAPDLVIGAVPTRADPRDVLVSRDGARLADLPAGASVGTSSLRRAAQVRARRPDLHVRPIRGNVDTRLRQLADRAVDAVILAAAGLTRLGRTEGIAEWLPPDQFLPAPGQGALAVECRAESAIVGLLRPLDDAGARAEVEAERAFASALGADCRTPIGAFAHRLGTVLHLIGEVYDVSGDRVVRVERVGSADDPAGLGRALASLATEQGAGTLV